MKRRLIQWLSGILTVFAVISSIAEENGSLLLKLKPESDQVKVPSEITVILQNPLKPSMEKEEGLKAKVENLTAKLENIPPSTYSITVKSDHVSDFSGRVIITSGSQTEFDVVLHRAFTITGKILDRNSKPVEKAQLLARKDVKISEIDRSTFFSGSQHAETGPNGEFKLENLSEGPYKVRISHPDMIIQTESITVLPDSNPPKTFIMRSGLKIAGKIVEADGTPASGLNIIISGPIGIRGAFGMNRPTELLDQGAFAQSGLTMGKYNLEVRDALTKEPIVSVLDVLAGTTDLVIKLKEKCELQGIVTDSDKKPVAEAEISLRRVTTDKKKPGAQVSQKVTSTDSSGRFSINLLYGQKYEIKATRRPLLPGIQTVMLPDKPVPDLKPVSIVMQRGETVRGAVVSEKDNKPIAGLSVRVSPTAGLGIMLKDEMKEESTPTAADGKFTIEGLLPGVAKLVVTPTDNPRWILATKQVLVKRGLNPETTIIIKETGTVKGSVELGEAEEGKPRVSLHNPANPQQHFSVEPDETGNFILENIPPGTYIATSMSAAPVPGPGSRRTPPLTCKVSVKSGETSVISIKKEAEEKKDTFRLEGSVAKQSNPFGEGFIDLTPAEVDESAPGGMMMFSGIKRAKLDQDSNFLIENMEAGEYIYTIRPAMKGKPQQSFFMQETYNGIITVDKNQKKLNINISGSTLEGIVRNKQGFVETGANIIISPDNMDGIKKQRLTRHCQADADGKYSLDCIPEGVYVVNVRNRAGSASATERNLKISRKLHNLDLTLKDNCKISGKVTIPNSTSIRGASTVAVSCEDDSIPGYGTVSETGTYTITPKLPAGEYYVFSFKEGYAISESRIKLTDDAEVNGTLVPGGSIRVELSSSAGKPTANRTIHIKYSDGKEVMRCRKPSQWTRSGGPWSRLLINPTDSNGMTVIGGLKPGKYTVSIEGSEKASSVTVIPLQETTVNIDI